VIGPGEESFIEPGRPHTFSVVGESPGLRDLARLAKRYPREHFYLAYIPPALQRALLRPLA
jgi:hypothetical protein